MSKRRILIQLDSDPQASVFDAVVAIDAGTERLLQYANVKPEQVRDLIHGAMYTRGPQDLKNTAVFVGGSNVAHGEQIYRNAVDAMFDPFRVSVMIDCNGSNSTAAAAVISASKHVEIEGSTAMVLGATGPVGQRVAKILANEKCTVFLSSRSLERSQECVDQLIAQGVPANRLIAISSADESWTDKAIRESHMIFGCGAAGVRLVSSQQLLKAQNLAVAIDLNAVPPLGIEGIGLMDKAVPRSNRVDYGALGVGGLKMKIHKASVASLFENNGRTIDCQEMMAIGRDILARESTPS